MVHPLERRFETVKQAGQIFKFRPEDKELVQRAIQDQIPLTQVLSFDPFEKAQRKISGKQLMQKLMSERAQAPEKAATAANRSLIPFSALDPTSTMPPLTPSFDPTGKTIDIGVPGKPPVALPTDDQFQAIGTKFTGLNPIGAGVFGGGLGGIPFSEAQKNIALGKDLVIEVGPDKKQMLLSALAKDVKARLGFQESNPAFFPGTQAEEFKDSGSVGAGLLTVLGNQKDQQKTATKEVGFEKGLGRIPSVVPTDLLARLRSLRGVSEPEPVNKFASFFSGLSNAKLNPLAPKGFNFLQLVLAGLGGVGKARSERRKEARASARDERTFDLNKLLAESRIQNAAQLDQFRRGQLDISKERNQILKEKGTGADSAAMRRFMKIGAATELAKQKVNDPKALLDFAKKNTDLVKQLAGTTVDSGTLSKMLGGLVTKGTSAKDAFGIATIEGLSKTNPAFIETLKRRLLEQEMLKLKSKQGF